MMQEHLSNQNSQRSIPTWWMWLVCGLIVGQNVVVVSETVLDNFLFVVDKVVVTAYCFLVFLFLFGESFVFVSVLPILQQLFRKAKLPLRQRRKRSAAEAGAAAKTASIENEEQPVDLTGAYRWASQENFDAFLEIQGVPWALRRAALNARPVHRIKHKGNRLTIRIEAMVTSQTTYILNGPAVETNVRGRIFKDRASYLPSGDGIEVRKTAVTENYDVIVTRQLRDNGKTIFLTGRAEFNDGRDPIESYQTFERIEEE